MVGREVGDLFPKTPAAIGDVVLEVEGLESAGVFHDVSFEVRAGEIVGLAGLVGRRPQRDRPRGLRRRRATTPARSACTARPVPPHDPRAAIRAGMAFVPEDRRKQGLVIDASVGRNVAGVIRGGLDKAGLLTAGAENRAAGPWAARLEVKTSALDMTAATMSGGNQQKVVIAKWLATDPRLLIIDEPTRGIDVGTKAEVHRLLSELAGQGLAILMISSELPEVLGMADRVLVVCEGRITADLPRDEATPEAVMPAATRSSEAAHELTHERRSTALLRRLREDPDERPSSWSSPASCRATRRAVNTVLRSRELAIVIVLVADRGGRHRQEPQLPVQLRRLARPAAHPVDPAAARGRPDGRDHHPQRRPLGRLGARRSRRTSPAGCSSTTRAPDRAGLPAPGSWSARCSAWSTACWWRSARCRRW